MGVMTASALLGLESPFLTLLLAHAFPIRELQSDLDLSQTLTSALLDSS
jgi:hypothetical protein